MQHEIWHKYFRDNLDKSGKKLSSAEGENEGVLLFLELKENNLSS